MKQMDNNIDGLINMDGYAFRLNRYLDDATDG